MLENRSLFPGKGSDISKMRFPLGERFLNFSVHSDEENELQKAEAPKGQELCFAFPFVPLPFSMGSEGGVGKAWRRTLGG